MRFKELGKIFDPTEHELDFSQSPQALVFDDFVRIYFSNRKKDLSGKYLSHISYVDMDKNFKTILHVSDKTVMRLGNLGCFDEHGIFPMNVLWDGDRVLAYTGGWSRRTSVSVDGSIGLAVSSDKGETFMRVGEGPVLTSSLSEPFLVTDPFVKKIGEEYHMLYIYGKRWIDGPNQKERVYKIGHAFSRDGITWSKTGLQLIKNKLGKNECQALPTMIKIGTTYHMVFCYREAIDFRTNKQNSYRLGYAHSEDMINWIRDDSKLILKRSEEGWDSQMMCYPHLFECDKNIFLLYNGNEFGRSGFGISILEGL